MRPPCCPCAASRRRSERYRRSGTSASTATRARSTRSSGRTGPGNRHCWGSRAASSLRTRGPSRSEAADGGAALPPRPGGSGSAWRIRPTRTSSTSRSPRTSTSPRPGSLQPAYGPMEEWAAEKLAEFELDVPVDGARRARCRSRERQLLEVVKALLAEPKVLLLDEPTTALGPEDVERLHALVLEQSRAGVGIVYVSHRLPEVLGIADRITVLRDGVGQGTFEAAGHVGGEPRRSDDRPAAPARLSRAARRPRPTARCSSPSRACKASASARSTSRSRRARSSGSPAPRATGRCRSCGRSPASSARPAAPTCNGRELDTRLAARPAPGGSRAAQRRPGRGVALPRPERAGQHDDPGAAAAGTLRVPEPPARARHGRPTSPAA